MKVILTQNVEKLGSIGEVVDVKSGFARNYLLPQQFAQIADIHNVRSFEHQKRMVEQQRLKDLKNTKDLADKINGLSLTIPRKVVENEKLYGSVTVMDILQALKNEGVQLDKSNFALEDNIKELGIYSIPIKLKGDVEAKLKVWVVEE